MPDLFLFGRRIGDWKCLFSIFLGYSKVPPPPGQGRFIKIADPSVCPKGGLLFFLVLFKIPCFLPCISKELLGDMTCILLRLFWLLHPLFFVLYSLRHTSGTKFFICRPFFFLGAPIFFLVLVSNNRLAYVCVFIISGRATVHGGCVRALHHILCPSFYRGAFVHCMFFGGASHRSVFSNVFF